MKDVQRTEQAGRDCCKSCALTPKTSNASGSRNHDRCMLAKVEKQDTGFMRAAEQSLTTMSARLWYQRVVEQHLEDRPALKYA